MKKLFVLLFTAAAVTACGDASELASAAGDAVKDGADAAAGAAAGAAGEMNNAADDASQNMSEEDAAAAMNALKESAENGDVDMSDMMPAEK